MKTRKNKCNEGGNQFEITFVKVDKQKDKSKKKCKYNLKLIKELSISVCDQFLKNLSNDTIKENYTVTKEQDDPGSPVYYSFELKKEIKVENIKITSLYVLFAYDEAWSTERYYLGYQVNFDIENPNKTICTNYFANLVSKVGKIIYNKWIITGKMDNLIKQQNEKPDYERVVSSSELAAASAERRAASSERRAASAKRRASSERRAASAEKKLASAALASAALAAASAERSQSSSLRGKEGTYMEGVYNTDADAEPVYMFLPGPGDPASGGKKRHRKTRRKRKTH